MVRTLNYMPATHKLFATIKVANTIAVCVRFDNGHSGDGEKDFLRSMPDSIDAVILENAATLNSADLERHSCIAD